MPRTTKPQRDPYVTARTSPFTNKEMEVIFDVTPMTLHNWKHGTPTKGPMPYTKKGRDVRYPVAAVMRWAKKHGVPVIVHPDDLASAPPTVPAPLHAHTEQKKPGPKPKAVSLTSERPLAS